MTFSFYKSGVSISVKSFYTTDSPKIKDPHTEFPCSKLRDNRMTVDLLLYVQSSLLLLGAISGAIPIILDGFKGLIGGLVRTRPIYEFNRE